MALTNTIVNDAGGSSSGGGESASEEIEVTKVSSSSVKNEPVPTEADNAFDAVYFTADGLIYDPTYITKIKNPTIHTLINRLNRLAIAVTDLQTVLTNLIEEDKETREVVENVWEHTKACCDNLGITYTPTGEIWDGSGVLEEDLAAYKCNLEM